MGGPGIEGPVCVCVCVCVCGGGGGRGGESVRFHSRSDEVAPAAAVLSAALTSDPKGERKKKGEKGKACREAGPIIEATFWVFLSFSLPSFIPLVRPCL